MKKILIFIICCLFCFPYLMVVDIVKVIAEEEYTSPLNDLSMDPNFNKDIYIEDVSDYSLEIITVAESENNELFVYVYQPSKNMYATSINISRSLELEFGSYKNYKMKFIKQDGVFFKYAVEDLIVDDNKNNKRVYEIASIFRRYNVEIDKDKEVVKDNSINEVVYPVGKRFEIVTLAGRVEVGCQDVDLITVTDKYVGYLRYKTNLQSGSTSNTIYKDCHFVAFDTDKTIDKLLNVDLCYEERFVHEEEYYANGVYTHSSGLGENSIVKKYVTLYDNDKTSGIYETSGFWGIHATDEKTFNRIETSETFLSEANSEEIYKFGGFNVISKSQMDTEAKNVIKEMPFVLRFCETEAVYTISSSTSDGFPVTTYTTCGHSLTLVGNVTLLRLAFETDGEYYNLGVVDNKTTGSIGPSNTTSTKTELALPGLEDFKELLGIILGLVALAVLAPIIPIILKLIISIFKLIFKILTIPFWIFKRW